MGLDLAMGGLILLSAIRGWLKGFVVQAIRLVGLVAAVFAAAPARDQIRSYVASQFPTVKPEIMDRMLWWSVAIAGYFLIVGAASLVVAVSRRKTFGVEETSRGDQFAGFGLGVLKGLIVASFIVAGLKYAEPQLAKVAWAEQQKSESYAWKWHDEYHPAARIWAAPPVQSFVKQIQEKGLMGAPARSAKPESAPAADKETAVQTASRTPNLAILPGLPERGHQRPRRRRGPYRSGDP